MMMTLEETIYAMTSFEKEVKNPIINIIDTTGMVSGASITLIEQVAKLACSIIGLSYRDIIIVDKFYDNGVLVEGPTTGMMVDNADDYGISAIFPVLISSSILTDMDELIKTVAHELRHVWQWYTYDTVLEEHPNLLPLEEDVPYEEMWIEVDAYLFEEYIHDLFFKQLAV